MGNEKRLVFGPFSLDLADESLWRGSQPRKLRPKAFAVLHYLVTHPRKLVTKEEIFEAVWAETFVGEAVLKVVIRQIREALGDDPKSPRFIETAHRRGYRFIADVGGAGKPSAVVQWTTDDAIPPRAPNSAASSPAIVGRDEPLAQLQSLLAKARRGERQVVFVTGEAGIGKTALVDTFATAIASDRAIRIGRGQCLEQYGTGEAYLPVLDAMGRLCREQPRVVDIIRAHAPMWFLQMPSLVSASEREALSRELSGATRERMLREMAEALEVLTADRPLVLILEDLHWSDYSTLDLISYLARLRHPAQLMLLGTYRPVELIVIGHPLKAVKRELLAKQYCEELPLEYLGREAIAEYLSGRFPNHTFPAELSELIHERTEGNALFMVSAVNYLVSERLVAPHGTGWELSTKIEKAQLGVPDSIRQMIEKQLDHLNEEEQRTLEAASVAGEEFSALAVAAALEGDRMGVERRCDSLARQGEFIQGCGVHVLPDGQISAKYGFVHALYRNVLYERSFPSKRAELHRRIGEQGEVVYGVHAREIAAELAMHFERGHDPRRAAKHLQKAADNAMRRFAFQEAIGLVRQGLDLLTSLPDNQERSAQELCLQLTLGVPLIATQGFAAPEVGRTYMRARKLALQLGETPDVSEVLWGLWTFHTLRAEFGASRALADELLHLGERLSNPTVAMRGHWAIEITFTHLGEFGSAQEHFEKALSLYDPTRHLDDGFIYALNPGVAMPCFAAWALWFLGEPDRALQRIGEALTLAQKLSEPLGLAHALFFAAVLYQLRRQPHMTQKYAEEAIAVSSQHGLVMYRSMASIVEGWALKQGGKRSAIQDMRDALASLQEQDTTLVRPHFLALLFESLDEVQQIEEGRPILDEALAIIESNGEEYYRAELKRLKGELLLRQARVDSVSRDAAQVLELDSQSVQHAEQCFEQAINIARRQKANSLAGGRRSRT